MVITAILFQSLLFWMIGSGLLGEYRQGFTWDVSILVVLDDWFGPAVFPSQVFDVVGVSILVVLDDWFGLIEEGQGL